MRSGLAMEVPSGWISQCLGFAGSVGPCGLAAQDGSSTRGGLVGLDAAAGIVGCRAAGAAFRRNRAAHRWPAPAVKPVSGVLVEQFLIREGMEAGGVRVDSAGRADGAHGLREDADAYSRADYGRADARAWPERPRDQ